MKNVIKNPNKISECAVFMFKKQFYIYIKNIYIL